VPGLPQGERASPGAYANKTGGHQWPQLEQEPDEQPEQEESAAAVRVTPPPWPLLTKPQADMSRLTSSPWHLGDRKSVV